MRVLLMSLLMLPLIVGCGDAAGGTGVLGTEAVIRIPGATIQIESPMSESATPVALASFFISDSPSESFAANIILHSQNFAGNLNAYGAMSRAEFAQLGLTIIHTKTEGTGSGAVWEVEYAGIMGQKSLHWLAHATKVGETVLLVTCTSSAQTWAINGPLCRKGLASLRVKRD